MTKDKYKKRKINQVPPPSPNSPTTLDMQTQDSHSPHCPSKEEISDILLQQEILQGRLFEMETKLDQQEKEISSLKESKKMVDFELTEEKRRYRTLSNNLNDLEQYSRRNNIRIFGVRDNKKYESLKETENIVINLLRNKLNLNFGPEDFEICHRIGRYTEGANRAIIVKFLYRKSKILTISERKKLKDTGITISEDLTHKNVRRLNDIKTLSCVESCWSRDGRLYAKNSRGTIKEVKPEDQLSETLFSQLSSAPSSFNQPKNNVSQKAPPSTQNLNSDTSNSQDKTGQNSTASNSNSSKDTSKPVTNNSKSQQKNATKTPTNSNSESNAGGKKVKDKKQNEEGSETQTTNSQNCTPNQPPSTGDGIKEKQTSDGPGTKETSVNKRDDDMEITCSDEATPVNQSSPKTNIDDRLKSIAGF